MPLTRWTGCGLLLVCLCGCGQGKSTGAPTAAETSWAAKPEGSLWDALAMLPVLRGKVTVAVFDYPTLHDQHHRWRGTTAGNFLVNVWDTLRALGAPPNSVDRVVYVNDAGHTGQDIILCRTRLSGDDVTRLFKSAVRVEGACHGVRAWRPSDTNEYSLAYFDGWVVNKLYCNVDEQKTFERILKVHAGEEPSLRSVPGVAELVAAGPKEHAAEMVFGDTDFPFTPPRAQVEWSDATQSHHVVAFLYDTEKDARAGMEQLKAQFEKMTAALRAGEPVPEVGWEAHGTVFRGTAGEMRPPASLVRSTRFDLARLAEDLRHYRDQHGRYPTTAEGLAALAGAGASGPDSGRYLRSFLGEVPLDVWGHPFIYQFPHPTRPNEFDLRSAGPDGQKDTLDDVIPENR